MPVHTRYPAHSTCRNARKLTETLAPGRVSKVFPNGLINYAGAHTREDGARPVDLARHALRCAEDELAAAERGSDQVASQARAHSGGRAGGQAAHKRAEMH